jgi:hypothetical protein
MSPENDAPVAEDDIKASPADLTRYAPAVHA